MIHSSKVQNKIADKKILSPALVLTSQQSSDNI